MKFLSAVKPEVFFSFFVFFMDQSSAKAYLALGWAAGCCVGTIKRNDGTKLQHWRHSQRSAGGEHERWEELEIKEGIKSPYCV